MNRDFKGVWIPAKIWLDKQLTTLEKVILTEIDSLDNGEKGCYASNQYFADFCQCSERKVQETVTKLKELGYITLQSFDGRTRKLHSNLNETRRNCGADPQNLRHNNIKSISSTCSTHSTVVFSNGFDVFYELYPKKKARQDALKAWNKLKPSQELQQTIIADIETKLCGEWRGKDRYPYIPYPATYLNGRRWEDESEMRTCAKPTRPPEPELTDEQAAIIDELTRKGLNYG